MTTRHTTVLLVLLSLWLCTGCGSMMIETNRADAEIYLDGQHIGTGRATVRRMGVPNTSFIRAESGDEVVEVEVKRHFTLTTALLMPFSYFSSVLWAWQYPDETLVQFKGSPAPTTVRSWDTADVDLWGQPLYPQDSPSSNKHLGSDAHGSDPWKVPLPGSVPPKVKDQG